MIYTNNVLNTLDVLKIDLTKQIDEVKYILNAPNNEIELTDTERGRMEGLLRQLEEARSNCTYQITMIEMRRDHPLGIESKVHFT